MVSDLMWVTPFVWAWLGLVTLLSAECVRAGVGGGVWLICGLQVNFTVDNIRKMMDFRHNIRNISVIAHVDQ